MPEIVLPGLTVGQADLCALDMKSNSLESVSCLHVLEHVGLGRYGDPLDPRGDRRAAEELTRVLAPGGLLLMVVPVGRSRVNFNAHRVYSLPQVLGLFPGLTLKSSSLIPDDPRAGMIENPPEDLVARQAWGCGCFVFSKPAAH
jgi:SAM-dependent methyltransferase